MADEAAEVTEEIMSVTDETMEEMSVSTEVEGATDNVIDVSQVLDDVLTEVNTTGYDNLVAEDVDLAKSINIDATKATENIVSNIEESGCPKDEIIPKASAAIPSTSAEQMAGTDAVKETTGTSNNFFNEGKRVKRGLEVFMIGEFVARQIYNIVATIKDSDKTPAWKGSLTKSQKEQLKKLSDATSKLKDIISGWKPALEQLHKNLSYNYGTLVVVVGGVNQTVKVINVASYLIDNTYQQLATAQKILQKGIESLSVFEITEIENQVFNSFSNIQALINLRTNKSGKVTNDQLSLFKFPPPDDDVIVRTTLNKDFPEWKKKVMHQSLTLAKVEGAKAIGFFIKAQVILKVNKYMRDSVFPVVKAAAKEAGLEAAKSYVSGEKHIIIEKALIPVVGTEMARKYGEKVRKIAIQKAKAAATDAGQKKAKELMTTMNAKLKPIISEEINKDKSTMKSIGKYAAEQILDLITPPGKKGISKVTSLPPGVTHAQIGHTNLENP